MKDIDDLLKRIDDLEIENKTLKTKLNKALWQLKSSSVEDTYKFQVMTPKMDIRMSNIMSEKKAAMKRFTKRLNNEIKKHKETK